MEKGNLDDLLAKYLSGETQPDEAMEVDAWLQASPDNRKHFERTQAVWSMVSRAAWKAPDTTAVRRRIPVTRRVPRRWLATGWRAAVSVIVLATILYTWNWFKAEHVSEVTAWATHVSQTAIDSVQLADGSALILHGDASITYPIRFREKRLVRLVGEGFFDVRHDDHIPFHVEIGELTITVLGTAFHVKPHTDSMLIEVAVVRGSVRASVQSDSLIIEAGNTGVYDQRNHRFWLRKVIHSNDPNYTTTLSLEYDNATIETVFRDIASNFNVEIVVADPRVNQCRITGSFAESSLETLLEIITQSLELKYTIRDNFVYVSGHGCY